MTSIAAGQKGGPSRKKARRSSRHGETIYPSHYGPVACTSAASALVQAYLAVDTAAVGSSAASLGEKQLDGGSTIAKGCNKGSSPTGSTFEGTSSKRSSTPSSNKNSNAKDALRATGDSSSFLHMSESIFDPVKRRFGGKSKAVTLANSVTQGAAMCVSRSSSSSISKGVRLSFSQGTKVVATREVMHATLHCRCVFVLLCELASSSSEGRTTGKASPSDADAAAAGVAACAVDSSSADTAHLVTLSPDDLFCALSVDSFPLLVPTEPQQRQQLQQQQQAPAAAGALPRAFEVVDGPAVIHRPAARQGEPWQGLEVFRSDLASGLWRGHRVRSPGLENLNGEDGGDGNGGSGPPGGGAGSVVDGGGGDDGTRGGKAFLLDLSGTNAAGDGSGDSVRATLPPSQQESGTAANINRRTTRPGGHPLVVCPPMTTLSATGSYPHADYHGYRRSGKLGGDGRGCTVIEGAVIALPTGASSAPAGRSGGGESAALISPVVEPGGSGEDFSLLPPPRPPPEWASLSVDRDGRVSLAPWRGLPLESRKYATCLCRAPDIDSGVVSLATNASGSGLAGGAGGLLLRSLPPTVYVGMAEGNNRRTSLDGERTEGSAGVGGGRGAVFELQGCTLSSTRLLPAPPLAVTTAAVDDAQGVLAVLLADQAKTALILARDGCDFPTVEEHRGIAAVFAGDFLRNGREQVALLCSASTVGSSSGSGGVSRVGKKGGGAAGAGGAAAVKAGTAGWEQLPLKALVKRAIVTDCSFVWEHERRSNTPAAPLDGGGRRASNSKQGDPKGDSPPDAKVNLEVAKDSSKGKKRARPEEMRDEDALGDTSGKAAPGSPETAGPLARRKTSINRGPGDDSSSGLDRLSSVVQVVRRRVQGEEARLLRLRHARRGKAALLEAARLTLVTQVGNGAGLSDKDGDDANGKGSSREQRESFCWFTRSPARAFVEGLVAPNGGDSPTTTSNSWICEEGKDPEASSQPPATTTTTSPAPLTGEIARARFHAPSRKLCLDARISNPRHEVGGNGAQSLLGRSEGPSAAVVDVCLAVSSSSVCLTTRSAVCPLLRPGESVTVRAYVDVPLGLLAGTRGGAAPLFVSCTWSPCDSGVAAAREWTEESYVPPPAAAAAAAAVAGGSGTLRPSCSLIFSRVLVSPRDMLGVGGALSSTAQAPASNSGHESHHRSFMSGGGGGGGGGGRGGGVGNKKGTTPMSYKGGGTRSSNSSSNGNGSNGRSSNGGTDHHLGLFDVGTRLNLLLRSDPAATSLATLPQAVRSLSAVAALPEPWAGGAAVQVHGCSERAAECSLSTEDAASAPAVLLAVAAQALPDGVQASADHASEQGRALLADALAALQDEIAALEDVARERGRLGVGAGGGNGKNGGGGGSGNGDARGGQTERKTEGLAAALERYRSSQMRSDLLAARIVGQVMAAR